MWKAFIPRAHGAWIILATAILLGLLYGEQPGPGALALSLAAIFGFCTAERAFAKAWRAASIHALAFCLAAVWSTFEVPLSQLVILASAAGAFAIVQFFLRHRRVAFEVVGMVSLSLVLPAVSLATGCPVGWPLFALTAVFAMHVMHAAFRTRAHLSPKRRPTARIVGLGAGLVVLGLLLTGSIGIPIALAVGFGLAEPWAPDWTPLRARTIGLRETALIALVPVAFLVQQYLDR